eukprot:403340956
MHKKLGSDKNQLNKLRQIVYQNTRESKPIDRENIELKQVFKLMLDVKNKKINDQCRVSKSQIKLFLAKRYKQFQVEKIMNALNFSMQSNIEEYCSTIDRFLFKEFMEKMRLAFAMKILNRSSDVNESILKFKVRLNDISNDYEKTQSNYLQSIQKTQSQRLNSFIEGIRKYSYINEDETNKSFMNFCANNYSQEYETQANQDQEQSNLKQVQTSNKKSKPKQEFDIKEAFSSYVNAKRINKDRDTLDFMDFCKIQFDSYYPEIIVDMVFYLARHHISRSIKVDQSGQGNLSYRQALVAQVNDIPLVHQEYKTNINSSLRKWRYSQTALEQTIKFIGTHPLNEI